MQLKTLLISATLITQTIQASPRFGDRDNMMQFPQKAISEMIKNEAKQIQSGLRALELNKELSINHFTREQLNVVKGLAQRFIQCAKQSTDPQKCAQIRERMNMVDDNGRFVTSIGGKDTSSLIGTGDVLSGIGDSLQMMNNPELLRAEYAEILKSLPKQIQRNPNSFSVFKIKAGSNAKCFKPLCLSSR